MTTTDTPINTATNPTATTQTITSTTPKTPKKRGPQGTPAPIGRDAVQGQVDKLSTQLANTRDLLEQCSGPAVELFRTAVVDVQEKIEMLATITKELPEKMERTRRDPFFLAVGASVVLVHETDKVLYGPGPFTVEIYGLMCRVKDARGAVFGIPRARLVRPTLPPHANGKSG